MGLPCDAGWCLPRRGGWATKCHGPLVPVRSQAGQTRVQGEPLWPAEAALLLRPPPPSLGRREEGGAWCSSGRWSCRVRPAFLTSHSLHYLLGDRVSQRSPLGPTTHAACGAPGRASREPWCAGVRASAALRDTLRALPPGGLQGALSPDMPRAAALHPASRHHGQQVTLSASTPRGSTVLNSTKAASV